MNIPPPPSTQTHVSRVGSLPLTIIVYVIYPFCTYLFVLALRSMFMAQLGMLSTFFASIFLLVLASSALDFMTAQLCKLISSIELIVGYWLGFDNTPKQKVMNLYKELVRQHPVPNNPIDVDKFVNVFPHLEFYGDDQWSDVYKKMGGGDLSDECRQHYDKFIKLVDKKSYAIDVRRSNLIYHMVSFAVAACLLLTVGNPLIAFYMSQLPIGWMRFLSIWAVRITTFNAIKNIIDDMTASTMHLLSGDFTLFLTNRYRQKAKWKKDSHLKKSILRYNLDVSDSTDDVSDSTDKIINFMYRLSQPVIWFCQNVIWGKSRSSRTFETIVLFLLGALPWCYFAIFLCQPTFVQGILCYTLYQLTAEKLYKASMAIPYEDIGLAASISITIITLPIQIALIGQLITYIPALLNMQMTYQGRLFVSCLYWLYMIPEIFQSSKTTARRVSSIMRGDVSEAINLPNVFNAQIRQRCELLRPSASNNFDTPLKKQLALFRGCGDDIIGLDTARIFMNRYFSQIGSVYDVDHDILLVCALKHVWYRHVYGNSGMGCIPHDRFTEAIDTFYQGLSYTESVADANQREALVEAIKLKINKRIIEAEIRQRTNADSSLHYFLDQNLDINGDNRAVTY